MKRYLVYYILYVFSVIIIYLNNGKAQSIPMHIIMYMAPFLLFAEPNKFKKEDLLPFTLMFFIFLTCIIHPKVFRLSTVLYSIMFIFTYMYFTKLVRYSKFNYLDLLKLSRIVIIGYAIVLLMQHVGVLLNFPILNENPGIIYDSFKTNSLSNESSHTGPIVSILFFSFIKMREIQLGIKKISFKRLLKNDKWVVYCFYYVIIGSISVTCILSMLIITLYFISKKNIISGSVLFLIILTGVIFSNTALGERIRILLPSVLYFDPQALYFIDPSSSARIGPIMTYIIDFKPFDINTWLGYGCDYGTSHVMYFMTGKEVEDSFGDIGVGGIINFIYNYGMVPFLLFLSLVIRITKVKSFLFIIYLSLFFVSPFNVHMTWLFVMLAYSINFYINQKKLCAST